MNPLAALAVKISSLVYSTVPQAGLELRRVESRLRALWTWRNGRERAAICGVIHC